MEENAEYGGQPEILAQVHAIERPINVHCEDSDTDCSCTDILFIQENVMTLRVT